MKVILILAIHSLLRSRIHNNIKFIISEHALVIAKVPKHRKVNLVCRVTWVHLRLNFYFVLLKEKEIVSMGKTQKCLIEVWKSKQRFKIDLPVIGTIFFYLKKKLVRIFISKSKHFEVDDKDTFLSEDTDVFVMTPNRRTFFFPETENLNFGDWKLLRNRGCLESLEACKM